MPGQVYTLAFLRFLLHTMNPSERHIQSKGVRHERIPYSTMGWQLAAGVSWLPRLEASHMICFSHQRERACPQPLICFSHDLDLWVFAQCLSEHKEMFFFLPGHLKGNRKCQTFASSFGYPPFLLGMIARLVRKIMSHLVRLASPVKNPKQHFAKTEKWLGSHLCFGTFLWVIAGRLRLRERDVG